MLVRLFVHVTIGRGTNNVMHPTTTAVSIPNKKEPNQDASVTSVVSSSHACFQQVGDALRLSDRSSTCNKQVDVRRVKGVEAQKSNVN